MQLKIFLNEKAYKGTAEETYNYYLEIDNPYTRALFRRGLFTLYHKKNELTITEKEAKKLANRIMKKLLLSAETL